MGKKNKTKHRTRFQMLTTEITNSEKADESGVIKLSILLDQVNGVSKVFNALTNEVIESKGIVTGYIGENKWRTTMRLNSAKDDHSYNIKPKLERFKHLIAIDTNTAMLEKPLVIIPTKISVGVAVTLIERDGKHTIQKINQPFLASGESSAPENENWMQLIEHLRTGCQSDDPRLIGIIVDSDLGKIDDYNRRIKPIFKDYYLPEGYELIYASDKVNDHVFNKMIHCCHTIANMAIEAMKPKIKDFFLEQISFKPK